MRTHEGVPRPWGRIGRDRSYVTALSFPAIFLARLRTRRRLYPAHIRERVSCYDVGQTNYARVYIPAQAVRCEKKGKHGR